MLPLLLSLAFASAPGLRAPAAHLPAPSELLVFEVVERLSLSAPNGRRPRQLELEVDPLARRIELRTADAPALAARLRAQTAGTCPTVEASATMVVLLCLTPRIDAELVDQRGRLYLDVRALRGLPFRGPEQQLAIFYDPRRLSVPKSDCPGDTPATRGECALRDGRRAEAILQFRLAASADQSAHASLRLGDIALAAGDVPGALDWYVRAGTMGPFGRLAAVRLCELTGGCLSKPKTAVFDWSGTANPVRGELMLRGARADLFAGRVPAAIRRLSEALMTSSPDQAFCDEIGQLFCRRLMLGVLANADRDSSLTALETYLTLPHRTTGPMALELAEAAAERAAAVGAPVFGGNLLTSVFMEVPSAHLRGYLLRTAELYGAGGDWARARLIFDYAETRFPARALADARWNAIRATLRDPADVHETLSPEERARLETLATGVARDVATAFGILARGRVETQ